MTVFFFLPKFQIIRSNNGTKFLKNSFQPSLQHNGIIHQRDCVNAPQQNGVVERKQRHLLNVARALRIQAHLLLKFWEECVLTAAYLINKMSTLLLKHKSSHRALCHSKPNYAALQVFGSLCYLINKIPRKSVHFYWLSIWSKGFLSV